MKELLSLIICLFVIFLLAGCGRQNRKAQKQTETISQTAEDIFPEVMVGVWEVMVNEYSGSKWGIKFEPDGSIKKIIHSLAGPVNITEGGVHAGTEEAYYTFVMGPCKAKYIPETYMLKVKIFVDYFEMVLPAGKLEGRIEDYIEGPISTDGKTWESEWRSYGWLEGADPPDTNIIDANPEKLVFTKIDVNDIK